MTDANVRIKVVAYVLEPTASPYAEMASNGYFSVKEAGFKPGERRVTHLATVCPSPV